MPRQGPSQFIVKFGVFQANLQTGELYRDGLRAKLPEQSFQVLVHLLARPGELVTREELRRSLWPEDTFVDFDHGVNVAVNRLREALGDSADSPRFIETLPRRGYRFIAALEAVEPASPVQEPAAPRSRLRLRLGALAAAAFLGAAGYLAWQRSTPPPVPTRVMLAVLPFENLTGDPAQDYFSDGLTEEMITQLGILNPQRLGVIARTSVMRYKDSREPLDAIARDLGVQYVLEGSVRRSGGNVRVAAQLIQASDQTHLWARQYDRELRDLLAVQGEIAQAVAEEIQLTLGDHPSASLYSAGSPSNYEAYDLYLQGQYFLNKRTDAGFEQAIAFFQQATVKDPAYARAYAGLAHSYALIADYGTRPTEELMSKARAAAAKALEIDPSLPEAHTALALILQSHDWDWQSAEKEFRRTIELNPNYATAHHWYAEHLMWLGRFDEALQESERARQLDPLSLIIAADNGAILYYSRQYDRAIEKLRAVLEVNPDFPRAFLIVAAYAEKGRVAEALAFVEAHRHQISTPYYWAFLAHIYGRNGQLEPARHALNELLQLNRRTAIDPVMLAWACAETGENDQALRWLEKAHEQHSNRLAGLKVNPAFDALRDDPRFQVLLRRMNFPK